MYVLASASKTHYKLDFTWHNSMSGSFSRLRHSATYIHDYNEISFYVHNTLLRTLSGAQCTETLPPHNTHDDAHTLMGFLRPFSSH
jgi:hypothetical protein